MSGNRKNSKTNPMPSPPQVDNEVPVGDSDTPSPIDNIGPSTVLDPVVKVGAKDPDSTVPVKKDINGFWVTATRKGFYNNLRKAPGDRFLISSKKKWGTWMKCDDPKIQFELELEHKKRIDKIRES
jgi:hypothetical protein